MADLTPQNFVYTGLNASYAAVASGGDTFPNTGREVLHIKNANAGSPRTVTIPALDATVDLQGYGTLDVANIDVAIPAEGDRFIGPIPAKGYGATPDITYSDSGADLTIAVLRLP